MKDYAFKMQVFISMLLMSICCTVAVSGQSLLSVKNTKWIPVDESDWAVYMAAPAYHFNYAKKYLLEDDKNSALTELKRGEEFLLYQKNKLSSAISEMEKLQKDIESKEEIDTLRFNMTIKYALNTVNHKYRMLPVNINGSTMFGSAHEYHLEKARNSMAKKNRKVSAEELRQASAFLKLKAASMGITPWSRVEAARVELEQLAKKIETGKVRNVKEFDALYSKATSIFRNQGT